MSRVTVQKVFLEIYTAVWLLFVNRNLTALQVGSFSHAPRLSQAAWQYSLLKSKGDNSPESFILEIILKSQSWWLNAKKNSPQRVKNWPAFNRRKPRLRSIFYRPRKVCHVMDLNQLALPLLNPRNPKMDIN